MSRSRTLVPEAKGALDKFKMEAASEVGVNLSQGYNGDITARQAGSVGGQMVNIVCPVRTVRFERIYRWLDGHRKVLTYEVGVRI